MAFEKEDIPDPFWDIDSQPFKKERSEIEGI